MALPIKLEEIMRLTAKGITAADVNHNSVRMESDRFITVREASGNLSIIDMASPGAAPERKPMKAESVIMNPVAKVLALSAKVGSTTTLQIFNMEMKSKMKAFEFPEEVSLWKWIDTKTIGIVTPGSVYHWSMEGDSGPVKIFDKHGSMAGCQILNYKASPDMKWLVLNGIKQEAGQIVGAMQLYSIDKKISQPMAGFAATFAKLTVAGSELQLFCFCGKSAAGTGQVQIIKIGGATPFDKKNIDIGAFEANDFPVAM